MGLAVVTTRAGLGMDAPKVNVEVHLANGLPGFHLVGMAETTVKEARDRVRGALINCGFEFPAKRITVNLAPADLPKQGGRFDLAIALGILVANQQLPERCLDNIEVIGELALSGNLRTVSGILPAAIACLDADAQLLIPTEAVDEVESVEGLSYTSAGGLNIIYAHLLGTQPLPTRVANGKRSTQTASPQRYWHDIIGQSHAKRALIVAASGAHHLLFVGPPGTGKSLLASKLPMLLPPLSKQQALSSACIRSIIGELPTADDWHLPPFRSPHHTASAVALTGGGSVPKPGEVTLAHHGVLFLDELPEFGRHTLDVLREPLENGTIHIARAKAHSTFPAQFQLIAAMNPSPTGDIYDGRCTPETILRYLNRLSGPLLDRIDIQIDVPRPDPHQYGEQTDQDAELSAQQAHEKVCAAREIQIQRQGCLNAHLPIIQLQQHSRISESDVAFLRDVCHQLSLSLRVFHRCIRVARTLADLDGEPCVTRAHLAESLSYRALDTLLREFTDQT